MKDLQPGRPEVTKSKDPDFAKTVRIFPHHMKGRDITSHC